MTAIFSFDEADEHLPRTRRNTVSSINSFDDRWARNTQLDECDLAPRVRHFGLTTWDTSIIAEEDDELPLRVGTPPIPIPNGKGSLRARKDSVTVSFDQDFLSDEVTGDHSLNKKMVPSDFEHVRVLGKGGYEHILHIVLSYACVLTSRYGTVLLVRHKASGKLFAQKQLKKASLVVQTKIVGKLLLQFNLTNIRIHKV